MSFKISGWQRLWILLAVIYLFVVVGFAFLFYQPPSQSGYKNIRHNKTVVLVRRHKAEQKIDDMMIELKQYLRKEKRDAFDKAALDNLGIDVKESKDEYIITVKDDEGIAFPKNLSPDTVVEALGKHLKENIKPPGEWDVVSEKPLKPSAEDFLDLKDKEIISGLHQKYGDSIDFSAIESEYKENELKYEKDKKRFLFKYVASAFAFWIIPMIAVYILGLSIGWVVKGFRKK
jgi:hypothetical protein